VVVAGFNVELEALSGKILFCYSLTTLQPIKDKLYSPYQLEEVIDPKWRRAIERLVFNSEIEVKAMLGHSQITVRDLINLEPGDVIVLNKKADEPVEVLVEGVPKYLAKMGIYRDHLALQVESFIIPEKEEEM
jgi:flagellar motor switch protein FliM